MSEINDLLPRRPLILGEAVTSEGMIPFQYEFNGEKVPTTQRLLKAIYGKASSFTYASFCKNFALANCLNCVVPSGQEIKEDGPLDILMSEYLVNNINDADGFDLEAFSSNYKERNTQTSLDDPHQKDTMSQIDLPLFAGRRVFLFGRGSLSLFQNFYRMPNITELRKSQEEVLHIEGAGSINNSLQLSVICSITPLYHPGWMTWFIHYSETDRQKLGTTLREASETWNYDWNYDDKEFFFNV